MCLARSVITVRGRPVIPAAADAAVHKMRHGSLDFGGGSDNVRCESLIELREDEMMSGGVLVVLVSLATSF